MKFRVMTLNTWCGHYLGRISKLVEKYRPDVLLLQEMTRGEPMNLPLGVSNGFEKIIIETKYQGVFGPIWKMRTLEGRYELGLAILSKDKMVRKKERFYYKEILELDKSLSGGKQFPGLWLSVEIVVDGRRVRVATTHFPWSMYPEVTTEQEEAIEGLVAQIEEEEELIFGGDMNVTDESTIYKRLTKVLIDDRPEGTRRTLHPVIHKAGEKELAVDFVMHKGGRIRKIGSEVLMEPVSDHLPVRVDYEIDEEVA